jgi:hypothetical protein
MQKLKVLFILTTLILLTACATSGSPESAMRSQLSPTSVPTDRLLIRTADLSIEVAEPKMIVSKIETIVSRESGYIDKVYDRDQEQISMTVKIPAQRLDSFIEEISSLGKLISKLLTARDVTEEMIDIEAKLKNLKALRTRFRQLLDKAQNVSDVLKIEIELSRIQTEIDSIAARRESLKNQVALSRVDIAITQQTIYGPLGYLGKGFYWVLEKLFVIK